MTWLRQQIGPLLFGVVVSLPLYLRWLFEACK
jgi:hypothetical protein